MSIKQQTKQTNPPTKPNQHRNAQRKIMLPAAAAPSSTPYWSLTLPSMFLGALLFVPINMYCLAKIDAVTDSVRNMTKFALITFSSMLVIGSALRMPRDFSFQQLAGGESSAALDAAKTAAYEVFKQTTFGFCVDHLEKLFSAIFLPGVLGVFTPIAIQTWKDVAEYNKYDVESVSNGHNYALILCSSFWGVAFMDVFDHAKRMLM